MNQFPCFIIVFFVRSTIWGGGGGGAGCVYVRERDGCSQCFHTKAASSGRSCHPIPMTSKAANNHNTKKDKKKNNDKDINIKNNKKNRNDHINMYILRDPEILWH